MTRSIRRTRAALRQFDPEQTFWHDARIIMRDDGNATLITYWRNPELAGIWEFHYHVLSKCFTQLLMQGLIEQDGSDDPHSFTLSALGRRRLSSS